MFEVTIKTQFSSAHRLRYYDGKYENLHGHNWSATVTVQARELDAIGLGVDFVKLRARVDAILARLDYRNLNEVPPFDAINPSAENIARWLFQTLAGDIDTDMVRVGRVEINEFPDSGAAYFE
jgi:6-pyruvoyltetrahydropterin/6-carboxytetrahydropterin synthase